MVIVWDEVKPRAKLLKLGSDVARFGAGFDIDGAVRFPVEPSRTGRSCFGLIGWLDGVLVVTTTLSPLGSEAVSLVSMRTATAAEKKRHGV